MNDNKHARLSPSSAHRWLECPGSVTLEAEYPKDIVSEFAEYGTAGHMLGEMCLRQDKPAKSFAGTVLNKSTNFPDGFEVDDEMIDAVQTYVDYCNNLEGDEIFIEKKVDFSEYVPEGFGTADYIKIHTDKKGQRMINVVDLKMGKGVKVDAKNNPQGMLYALGVMARDVSFHALDKINIVIVQPRIDRISEWELGALALQDWASTVVKPKAGEAWTGQMKFNPGEKQCRFCKASATCKALAEQSLQTAMDIFTDIPTTGDLKQIHTLSNSEVSQLLPRLDEIVNWVKSIKAFAFEQLEQGNDIEGYKLVRGRAGNRKWINEESAEERLRELGFVKRQIYNQVIITPPVADKMLRAKSISPTQLSNLYNQAEGKPTITDSHDPREALLPADGSVFDVIE